MLHKYKPWYFRGFLIIWKKIPAEAFLSLWYGNTDWAGIYGNWRMDLFRLSIHFREGYWPGSPIEKPCPAPASATGRSEILLRSLCRKGYHTSRTSGWHLKPCRFNASAFFILNSSCLIPIRPTFGANNRPICLFYDQYGADWSPLNF